MLSRFFKDSVGGTALGEGRRENGKILSHQVYKIPALRGRVKAADNSLITFG